jgi:ABC-type Na+ efflux pump permease subunit
VRPVSHAGLIHLAAASTIPAAPVVGLMTLGVVVAIVGHMAKNPRIVAFGVTVLLIATAMMILGAFFAFQGNEVDPRKPDNPRDPSF